MPKPPKWLEIARNQHISLTSAIQNIGEQSQNMMMNLANGVYDQNAVLLAKDFSDLHLMIGMALGLSQENGSLLEDNNRTISDKERWEGVKREQERANRHRRGE